MTLHHMDNFHVLTYGCLVRMLSAFFPYSHLGMMIQSEFHVLSQVVFIKLALIIAYVYISPVIAMTREKLINRYTKHDSM